MLLLAAVVGALLIGSVRLSLSGLVRGDSAARALFALRGPRVAMAAAVGIALALAGAALQALLKNPLADPFLLGTSGGAAAGAAVAAWLGALPLEAPLASFAGGAIASAAVAALGRRGGRIDLQRLLLAGIAANAFFSAVILALFSFSSGATTRSMLFWMMGSLSDADPRRLLALLPYLAAGAAVLVSLAPVLNLFLVGEESAASLGVAVEKVKLVVFFAACLLTAAGTAFVGIIGFVGLVAPHLARLRWGNDQRGLLPAAGLLGGALLVVADAVSRTVFSPAELPVGAMMALVGVPFFLVMLRRAG
jgi:iron complex transport system permease protein